MIHLWTRLEFMSHWMQQKYVWSPFSFQTHLSGGCCIKSSGEQRVAKQERSVSPEMPALPVHQSPEATARAHLSHPPLSPVTAVTRTGCSTHVSKRQDWRQGWHLNPATQTREADIQGVTPHQAPAEDSGKYNYIGGPLLLRLHVTKASWLQRVCGGGNKIHR